MDNQSTVTGFIFQAFSSHQGVQNSLFCLFLIVYLLTLAGNVAIIVVINADVRLHKPMYFLLRNFSFLEIWYTTSTIPNMLVGFLQEVKRISFLGCFIQFYFLFSLGTTETILLAIMAYDRCLAICKPLHYHTFMSIRVCQLLIYSCWMASFLWFIAPIILISRLPFCGPNVINHFLCDRGPLVALSCKRDYITEITFFVSDTVLNIICLSTVLVSYVYIICTIVRMPSAMGRQKAFSTCVSHLIVVCLFFGSVMFMYMRPAGQHSFSQDKVVAILYTVITPLLNPLIYTLRNKEVKQAFRKLLHKQ
ncbi:olfactory receptor 11H4-like [Lissotriton helveticus]